jgi:hypothetical protein
MKEIPKGRYKTKRNQETRPHWKGMGKTPSTLHVPTPTKTSPGDCNFTVSKAPEESQMHIPDQVSLLDITHLPVTTSQTCQMEAVHSLHTITIETLPTDQSIDYEIQKPTPVAALASVGGIVMPTEQGATSVEFDIHDIVHSTEATNASLVGQEQTLVAVDLDVRQQTVVPTTSITVVQESRSLEAEAILPTGLLMVEKEPTPVVAGTKQPTVAITSGVTTEEKQTSLIVSDSWSATTNCHNNGCARTSITSSRIIGSRNTI